MHVVHRKACRSILKAESPVDPRRGKQTGECQRHFILVVAAFTVLSGDGGLGKGMLLARNRLEKLMYRVS